MSSSAWTRAFLADAVPLRLQRLKLPAQLGQLLLLPVQLLVHLAPVVAAPNHVEDHRRGLDRDRDADGLRAHAGYLRDGSGSWLQSAAPAACPATAPRRSP